VCTNTNTALTFGDMICSSNVLPYGSESLYDDVVVVIIVILPV
jgi:hypothetical protein